MRSISRLLACALLLMAGRGSSAQVAAPMILGVQTHFAFSKTNAETFRSWMQRADLHSSRDEMFWEAVEGSPGLLEIRGGAVLTRNAWRDMPAPFDPLLILDYGHPAYDSGGQPRSDDAVNAFARYASYAVAQVSPPVRLVEVWNEWNGKSGAVPGRGSQGDAQDYVRLARETRERLRADHPSVRVLVGALADDYPDWAWFRKSVALGLLDQADGVSVHLYNHCLRPGQVGADEMMSRLDALRRILDSAGKPNLPVHVTEVGWPTHQGSCGVAEREAAVHTIRFLLEAGTRQWLEGVWLYELTDGGDNPLEQEQRFGLLRRDASEKPAGCAVRELGALLARRPEVLVRRGNLTLARYASAARKLWIVWSRSSHPAPVPARIGLHATSGDLANLKPIAVCNLAGSTLTVGPGAARAVLQFDATAFAVLEAGSGEMITLEDVLVR